MRNDEVTQRTDALGTLLTEVSYNEVVLIDIDAWSAGHIVRVIELLDAELQRRYDESVDD